MNPEVKNWLNSIANIPQGNRNHLWAVPLTRLQPQISPLLRYRMDSEGALAIIQKQSNDVYVLLKH